jgi:transmembrane sensor
MSSAGNTSSSQDARRSTAAAWVVRHDRGLNADEQAAFLAWLAEDPRNEAAWRRTAAVWGRFEAAVPARSAVPPRQPTRWRSAAWWAGGLAAAAAFALAAFVGLRSPEPALGDVAVEVAAEAPRTHVLADGTLARLNVGARIAESYSAEERRVRLLAGEAYFAVTRDPSRPFVVEADGVEVVAVGTAFGVSLASTEVDVLVTEGTVKVVAARPGAAAEAVPLVTAGHRAVVTRVAVTEALAVVVTEVDMVEVNRANTWRGGLLRLGGATLAELAKEFEAQTGRRMRFATPDLAEMRVGGRFPGDDVEGFARVLADHYGVNVSREADGTLLLDRAR